ncbi:hypothetical protein [Streptomyces mirabilis]|uniref:hypothetical protein n=1 Tax=Streptomyces mirabilis TaxID=68239 RepID=UPI0036CBE9A2
MSRPPLPMLVEADHASLCRVTPGPAPTLTEEGGGFRITLDTGRVQLDARYRLTAPDFEDGVPDERTRLSLAVTVDGAPVPSPGRWSGVVALVRNPDVLLPEHIADGDAFVMEVSGDHGETWREFGRFAGMIAREQIATIMREHHGHAEYEPGRLIIRGVLLSGSYSRHAWRFTRTRTAAKETSK